MSLTPELKTCSRCGKSKDLSAYHKKSAGRGGLVAHCKECEKKRWKEWYLKNSDKVIAYVKWKYNNSDEYRESCNESTRRYRLNNPEKCLQMSRNWRKANMDYSVGVVREWRKKNPGKNAEYNHRRRSLKINNGGILTAQDIREIRAENNECAICHTTDNLALDHIIPLSLGGRNEPQNIQVLCKSCNSSKHNKLPEAFARTTAAKGA